MLKLLIILFRWFWAKSKHMLLLVKISTKVMERKPSLRRLRIEVKVYIIDLLIKRGVMISNSCILGSWAFHHRRIVSLEFVFR